MKTKEGGKQRAEEFRSLLFSCRLVQTKTVTRRQPKFQKKKKKNGSLFIIQNIENL